MTSRERWTMVGVILGSAIVFLDTSVVNLALPRIGEELRSKHLGTLEAQSYVSNAYFLTLSAVLVLAGALTDFYGRRRMFAHGLAAFGVTSLLCGAAPTIELLILFRILQGVAGAFVVPGSLSIIAATFTGEERGRAFGTWAGASAATTILGPLVGGLLVNAISWRAAFLINLPFVAVAWYAMRYVAESRDEQATGRFDWWGSAVVALAVGGLAFGTIRGQQSAWRDRAAFVSLGLGALAAVALPIMMRRRQNPLVPPSLFRSRNFTVVNLATFVIYGALYVTFTFQGLFLIGTLGYNEPAAGLVGLPATLFLVLFSGRFGRLAERFGPRAFLAAGPAIMGLGLLWLTRIPPHSAPWIFGTGPGKRLLPPADYVADLLPGMLVFGMGLMMMVAPLTTTVMTSVPKHHAGLASAINNAISRVGAPLVTALVFIAVVSTFYGEIAARNPGLDTASPELRRAVSPFSRPEAGVAGPVADAARSASAHAFHLAMSVAVALLWLGAAIQGLGIRNPAPAARQSETANAASPGG
jgi:EmrB/QacA subfamily drug resistance transporter